jgi:hypothetical protein
MNQKWNNAALRGAKIGHSRRFVLRHTMSDFPPDTHR